MSSDEQRVGPPSGRAGRRRARLACALALAFAPAGAPAEEAPLGDHAARTVVVMVFDGLAPALLASVPTPAFDRLRREGSATSRLVPAFPTISLVNGFTLSTGCWPEHHGIVSNVFLDPKRGRYDHSADADWLTGCEGMHQAAERQGVRAAALGWYGAYSGSGGAQATVVSEGRSFDAYPTDAVRLQEVTRLLRRAPADRPRLILAYFQGPDAAEHFEGIDSSAAKEAARAVDAQVGAVLAAIDAMPDRERVVLFVTTDHGMLPVTTLVNLRKILSNHEIPARAVATGTTALLYFDDPAQVPRAEQALARYEPLEVFRPAAAPPWAHLGRSPRVGDLVVSARPPYFIEDAERWPAWARWIARWGPKFLWARFSLAASHGYPPDTPGVEGVLFARGSGIAKGRTLPSLRVIDVHPTVMHLLSLRPGRQADGRIARALLDESPDPVPVSGSP